MSDKARDWISRILEALLIAASFPWVLLVLLSMSDIPFLLSTNDAAQSSTTDNIEAIGVPLRPTVPVYSAPSRRKIGDLGEPCLVRLEEDSKGNE